MPSNVYGLFERVLTFTALYGRIQVQRKLVQRRGLRWSIYQQLNENMD
jgi:hypothetical protein